MDDSEYVEHAQEERDSALMDVEHAMLSVLAQARAIMQEEPVWHDDTLRLYHKLHEMIAIAQHAKESAIEAHVAEGTRISLQKSLDRRG